MAKKRRWFSNPPTKGQVEETRRIKDEAEKALNRYISILKNGGNINNGIVTELKGHIDQAVHKAEIAAVTEREFDFEQGKKEKKEVEAVTPTEDQKDRFLAEIELILKKHVREINQAIFEIPEFKIVYPDIKFQTTDARSDVKFDSKSLEITLGMKTTHFKEDPNAGSTTD